MLSRGAVRLTTSDDPVGAPIFYRDVPLMPSATKEGVIKPLDQSSQPLIAWRLRDVGRHDTRLLLKDMPTCANCHSFSLDGTTMGMDVDGPDGDKGAYALASISKDVVIDDAQVITWNAFEDKPEGHHTFGFLSRVSPDGRYVVSTVNESLYVRNFSDHKFIQVFYPTAGILAWYSQETGKIKALPGADDPRYVHCDAVWTPDGKTLIFARAAAREPYEQGKPQAEYAGDPNETPMLVRPLSHLLRRGARGRRRADTRSLGQRHEQLVSQGLARRQVAGLGQVQERPVDASGQPPVDRSGGGRRGAGDAQQHRVDELVAQLLAKQPLDGFLLEGQPSVHPDVPDPHRRERRRAARRC